jgi:hypothetical protein
MIQVKRIKVISQTLIPFEDEGVSNPAAIRDGNFVHIHRAVRQAS